MEPVTHLLTGACLSRAGFNRTAAYATLAMTIGAEFPDVDILWGYLGGPVDGFQHHRGITHTFLGVPFEAALIVGVVWGVHRWRVSRGKGETAAPVRWGVLWVLTLVALLSHLLLDFTNNYGIRPFFPFNPRWYAGSIVFIFEPVIFVALVGGLVAPWLFGLINAEVGAKRETFRGAGWAQAALLAVLCVWTWRFVEQQKALAMARGMDLSALRPVGSDAEAAERVSASPYPVNPYEWHVVVEAQDFYQVGEADAWRGEMADAKPSDLIYKGGSTLATLKAKQSRLGRAYLDWSQFPVVSDMAVVDRDPRDPEVMWVVTFRDLRFAYRVPFMRSKETPITGKVYLNDNREVVREEMNGKSEP